MSLPSETDGMKSSLTRTLSKYPLVAQISRFSIVGVLATLTYLIVANGIMLISSLDPLIASVAAYLVGMVVSFLGQSRFAFNVRRASISQAARFIVLSLCGLAISYFSVRFAVNTLDIHAFWGTLATAITIPILSFVVMKLWVFA